jgi:hypothetical protein
MAKPAHAHYENNLFYIGLNGLKLFFANAQSVAIYAIVLAVLSFLVGMTSNIIDMVGDINKTDAQIRASDEAAVESFTTFFQQDAGAFAVVAVVFVTIAFLVIVVSLLLYGVLEYTAARLALGEKVELKTAFKEVGRNLASYVWLYVVMTVKIFLWSLLLIVPGIIMAVRYSLAGTVFFAEGKRGNAAVKRSAELTKGAWFTTYAGFGLWNLITFSQITSLIMPGASALMYRQFRDVTDSGAAKPSAHWLSWLTFFVPLVLAVLFIGLLVLLALVLLASFAA